MTRSSESAQANARRTIEKCQEVLEQCQNYFTHQAEMNAQAHLSERVMYPPIHSAIGGVLYAIEMFKEAYPSG